LLKKSARGRLENRPSLTELGPVSPEQLKTESAVLKRILLLLLLLSASLASRCFFFVFVLSFRS